MNQEALLNKRNNKKHEYEQLSKLYREHATEENLMNMRACYRELKALELKL
jgi:hypothetical protein